MALELRPNCEFCDKDLPPDSVDACICTYECTFCSHCVLQQLNNVCPNCGGGFVQRPVRPTGEWRPKVSLANNPASVDRVHLRYSKEEIATLRARLEHVPPEDR